ncbi:thioredoxin domain-containing protein [Paenibacillus terrae]|nr:thioredoxin domain-containing protein [Paenibacillus terrae]
MTTHKVSNRLAKEKSPYLLQHAHNPVNWFPWSDEALKSPSATTSRLPIY